MLERKDGRGGMHLVRALALVAIFAPSSANASTGEPPESSPSTPLERVEITGEQTGPGLWKVTRAENVLWIAGTYAPVGKDLVWKSKWLEEVVSGANEIIAAPVSKASAADLGFFGALALLPDVWNTPYNPDGKRLKDRLPSALYDRWVIQRDRLFPEQNRDKEDLERLRPWFAADRIYQAALGQAGFARGNPVWERIGTIARERGIRIVEVKHRHKVGNAKGAILAHSANDMDDVACMEQTLLRLESGWDELQTRARAWAHGDLEALRTPLAISRGMACGDAKRSSAARREAVFVDIKREREQQWLDVAERALARNRVTVAVLPIGDLLARDGYVALLRSRGYRVDAPE